MLKILDTEHCSLFRAWYAWPGPNAALCYNAGIRGWELRSSIQRLAVDIMGWTIWCKSHIFGFNFLVRLHHSDHCANIPSRWHHNCSAHLVPEYLWSNTLHGVNIFHSSAATTQLHLICHDRSHLYYLVMRHRPLCFCEIWPGPGLVSCSYLAPNNLIRIRLWWSPQQFESLRPIFISSQH